MKNFTASLFIKEQGDLYRSEQTGELDYWEEQRENNVLMFCQPVSKYNIPPRLLRRYLKKHLTRLILDGKRNFIFMEHNLASKPYTFTDIAFELLTEKKQEYAVQIWGVSYTDKRMRPIYPYDRYLPMFGKPKSTEVFFYAISHTANVLLCAANKSGIVSLAPQVLISPEIINLNLQYQEDLEDDPEALVLGDNEELRALYREILSWLPPRRYERFIQLLARMV